MPNVDWIKVSTGLFDNRKIKAMRTLSNGNDIVLIWIMLLALAGKCNMSGIVSISERVPYSISLLSDEFKYPENIVSDALDAFELHGMIERNSKGFICVVGWEKHQNEEKLAKIREYNRKAKQKSREKQKECQENVKLDSQENVNACHGGDKISDKNIDNIYIYIVDYLNERCNTQFRASSKATRKHIHARLEEGFTLDDFKRVIDNKAASWLHDEKMVGFLRPQTLFGTKFESYLNERTKNDGQNGTDKAEPVLYGQWL